MGGGSADNVSGTSDDDMSKRVGKVTAMSSTGVQSINASASSDTAAGVFVIASGGLPSLNLNLRGAGSASGGSASASACAGGGGGLGSSEHLVLSSTPPPTSSLSNLPRTSSPMPSAVASRLGGYGGVGGMVDDGDDDEEHGERDGDGKDVDGILHNSSPTTISPAAVAGINLSRTGSGSGSGTGGGPSTGSGTTAAAAASSVRSTAAAGCAATRLGGAASPLGARAEVESESGGGAAVHELCGSTDACCLGCGHGFDDDAAAAAPPTARMAGIVPSPDVTAPPSIPPPPRSPAAIPSPRLSNLSLSMPPPPTTMPPPTVMPGAVGAVGVLPGSVGVGMAMAPAAVVGVAGMRRGSGPPPLASTAVRRNMGGGVTTSTARSSSPSSDGCFVWRVADLLASEQYWRGWFEGSTEAFLSIDAARMLVVSGADAMDTDLAIAQMQGKFQFVCVPGTGHHVQEDKPDVVAEAIARLISRLSAIMK